MQGTWPHHGPATSKLIRAGPWWLLHTPSWRLLVRHFPARRERGDIGTLGFSGSCDFHLPFFSFPSLGPSAKLCIPSGLTAACVCSPSQALSALRLFPCAHCKQRLLYRSRSGCEHGCHYQLFQDRLATAPCWFWSSPLLCAPVSPLAEKIWAPILHQKFGL